MHELGWQALKQQSLLAYTRQPSRGSSADPSIVHEKPIWVNYMAAPAAM